MASEERVVLITGATDGVGRRVAERLARPGTTVLVHGRDRGRAEQVLAAIRQSGGAARFYPADLSALAEIRDMAASVARDHARLDVMINNAGIGVGQGERETSRDGHELRFAVNYLGHFLLTRLLLPCLSQRSGARIVPRARIVNVSSVGQQAIDFADVMLTHGYSGRRAYCQSKLAQILMTRDLAEELSAAGPTVMALHPATYMDTTMVRRDGLQPMSSVDEGADAILNLVESPALAGRTGLYFNGLRAARPDAQADDPSARAALRQLSFRLSGLADPRSGGGA